MRETRSDVRTIRDYLPLPCLRIKIRAIIVTNRVGQSLKTITKAISSSCKVSLNALICAAERILIRGEFLLKPL